MVFLWRDVWVVNTFQAIGYTLSIICFATEHAVGCFCENNEKRIYMHDFFMVICLLATINVWRGFWVLLKFHFSESIATLSILNGVAWKLLMVFNCLNSLSGKGIMKDAKHPGIKSVKLSIQYFQKVLVYNPTNRHTHDARFIDVCVATKL